MDFGGKRGNSLDCGARVFSTSLQTLPLSISVTGPGYRIPPAVATRKGIHNLLVVYCSVYIADFNPTSVISFLIALIKI